MILPASSGRHKISASGTDAGSRDSSRLLIAYKAAIVAAEPALAVLTGRDDKVADELAAVAATRPDADGHKKIGETVTSLWARDTSWLAAASGTEDMGCVAVLWRHTR